MNIVFSFFVIYFSIFLMKKCSSSFDIASTFLTRNLGDGIKGPTINAIASSLPELFISSIFLFYFKDINGFSAGFATIIGSSAFNIAIIPTICYLYVYKHDRNIFFEINKLIIKQDVFFLLVSILILMLGLFIGINLYLSIFLILFYFIYIYYVIKIRSTIRTKNSSINPIFIQEESFLISLFSLNLFVIFFKGKVNKFSSTFILFLSIFIIGLSCYFLVIATEKISDFFNINLFFGAFIIAAIASSIPDTLLSMQDAKNNKFSDSFSNAFGSNIFDICIGIGLPVFVYSLMYDPIDISLPIERIGFIGNYIFDGNLFLWSLVVLFIFTILVSFLYYKKSLDIKSSIKIIFLYLIFILALILY